MHTTDQAKELWCPMVRIARHEVVTIENPAIGGMTSVHEEHHVVGGVNTDALNSCGGRRMSSDHQPLASCRCIGDKCAMWRWHQPYKIVYPRFFSLAPTRIVRDGEPTHGYCGIAGQPEVF